MVLGTDQELHHAQDIKGGGAGEGLLESILCMHRP